MKKTLLGCTLLITAFIIGCAGQLAMKQMRVDPSQVNVGNQVKIIVAFSGPKNDVASVIAAVQESPETIYTLNDSGENGDEKAGDAIWTHTVTVPWDTPSATYHLDIRALDKNGNEIGFEQQAADQNRTIAVTIL